MASPPPQPMDPEATVMVPTPGRRRAAMADAGAADAGLRMGATVAPLGRPEAPGVDVNALSGLNPLLALANGLLALVPQIRGSLRHSDPAGFRQTLVQQLSA